ncbi:fatty acid desaturase family protein [Derxia gummosa]|uniref:Fatty acid desaturase family protein n=1 Tax=Derxia gummosa DSM 723 TaxID=1121388 RepID=A0A8B6XB95_9BURK|nr:fatty acid desaturase [Derxia gummosa]
MTITAESSPPLSLAAAFTTHRTALLPDPAPAAPGARAANDASPLPPGFDAAAFKRDLDELRERVVADLGPRDLAHLRRVEWRGRLATLAGYATLWLPPNPLTAFCLSFGQITRWGLAHHILHRGYDRVPGVEPRHTSKLFARGKRRWLDWFDWIHPDAWHREHNVLHHYYTGEQGDPDLIERNVEWVRESKAPKALKYLLVLLTGLTWRFTYYAPSTISVVDPDDTSKAAPAGAKGISVRDLFRFGRPQVRKLWKSCYLPYALAHFVALPALFLPFGSDVALFVLGNKLLAEALLNLHSFMVIGPNHSGEDLCRFDQHIGSREEFYVHQVLGSANYATGHDLGDHAQIWLNYQIEHHLFPDLPALKYQEIQPEVKRICLRHGLPYVQESIVERFRKMVDIWVGNTSMKKVRVFPAR